MLGITTNSSKISFQNACKFWKLMYATKGAPNFFFQRESRIFEKLSHKNAIKSDFSKKNHPPLEKFSRTPLKNFACPCMYLATSVLKVEEILRLS